MKAKFTTPLLQLMLVLFFVIAGSVANAQSALPVTRTQILNEPTHIQKKILDNTPGSYTITDLVNYPLAVEEDRRRPGMAYITVYEFETAPLQDKMDIIVNDPNRFYIAPDSTFIPAP